MDILIVKLITWIIKVLLIVGKPITSASLKISGNRNKCLQYCINTFYHEVDDLKKPSFFGHLCIGVNMQYVVRIIMHLFLTRC